MGRDRVLQRAVAAQEAGRFDDEIVPVEVPDLRRAGTTANGHASPARSCAAPTSSPTPGSPPARRALRIATR